MIAMICPDHTRPGVRSLPGAAQNRLTHTAPGVNSNSYQGRTDLLSPHQGGGGGRGGGGAPPPGPPASPSLVRR